MFCRKKLLATTFVFALGCGCSVASTSAITDGVFYSSEVLGTIDFKSILSSTVTVATISKDNPLYSVDADNAFGGSDAAISWEAIYESAKAGNPVAQFCHADRCLQLATKLYNGEKFKKKFEAYMFLLISAIKGEFESSREKFTYLGDISALRKEPTERNLAELARSFAERL